MDDAPLKEPERQNTERLHPDRTISVVPAQERYAVGRIRGPLRRIECHHMKP